MFNWSNVLTGLLSLKAVNKAGRSSLALTSVDFVKNFRPVINPFAGPQPYLHDICQTLGRLEERRNL